MRYISVLNILILAASVFFAMCLFPPPSGAYCVYNHTNVGLNVCGETCHKCYNKDIDSGEHGCCPGAHKGCGGHTYITITPYLSWISGDYGWYAPIQVTSHGWVSFFGECKGSIYDDDYCDDVTVKVHNDDGDVIYHGGVHRLGSKWKSKCRDD